VFVVELTYTAPLEQVEALRREHLAWVDEHVAGGTVVVAGRRPDAAGGVIVMRAPSREVLDRLLEADPYQRAGVVRRSVTEFVAARVAPEISHLADGL
jgi:uncharacterized protein YciI